MERMENPSQWVQEGEICKVFWRSWNPSWEGGRKGIWAEPEQEQRPSDVPRGQDTVFITLGQAPGCPRKRRSGREGWKGPRLDSSLGTGPQPEAVETPGELCPRQFILAIRLPFTIGNTKSSLYLHFSVIHFTLPLFGNPSNLLFSKSISWPFKWKQLSFLPALPGFYI